MKTIKLKIIKASIEKNPNAGNTETTIQGAASATFFYEGYKIPELNDPRFIITEKIIEIPPAKCRLRGVISGEVTEANLTDWVKMGIEVNIDYGVTTIYHEPEPEYFYEYETRFFNCAVCDEQINATDIDQGEPCDVCQRYNTYPVIEYEKITEALK